MKKIPYIVLFYYNQKALSSIEIVLYFRLFHKIEATAYAAAWAKAEFKIALTLNESYTFSENHKKRIHKSKCVFKQGWLLE